MMFSMRRLVLFFLVLLISNVCFAQALYISDKIPIPIYPEAGKKKPAIKTLPSGTIVTTTAAFEDLSNDKKFIQIETQDGVVGWIETIYLTNEKPAQMEYLSLAAKYKAAEAKIADYETRLLDLQELRKEVKTTDWLRNQLNENRKKEEAYEQQIKLKDIALADLKITIANLEEQLMQLDPNAVANRNQTSFASVNPSLDNSLESDTGIYAANSSSIRFYTWLVLSLAVTLIIGILLGFVLLDYKSKKKSSYAKEY